MRKTSLESLGVSGSQLRNLGLIVVLLRRSIRAASLVSFALALVVASNVVYGADALVGRWLTTRSSDAGGMSYKGSLSYEIFPNGSFISTPLCCKAVRSVAAPNTRPERSV